MASVVASFARHFLLLGGFVFAAELAVAAQFEAYFSSLVEHCANFARICLNIYRVLRILEKSVIGIVKHLILVFWLSFARRDALRAKLACFCGSAKLSLLAAMNEALRTRLFPGSSALSWTLLNGRLLGCRFDPPHCFFNNNFAEFEAGPSFILSEL